MAVYIYCLRAEVALRKVVELLGSLQSGLQTRKGQEINIQLLAFVENLKAKCSLRDPDYLKL